MRNNKNRNNSSGFIALMAVIFLASGTLTFSFAIMASAILYADGVNKREVRIQTRLNADSCLETVRLMYTKDYFLNGTTTIPEFGCTALVNNDFRGNVSVDLSAELMGVKSFKKSDDKGF